MRDVPDLLIVAGAVVLAAGIGAIVLAIAGSTAAAVGATLVVAGTFAIGAGVLLDLDRGRAERERSRHGETPRVPGADK